MDLSVIFSAAVGILAGVLVALRVIAPLTKTKADDAVLARLESLEALIPGAKPPA
mgnify:CR=1 FL=1